MPASPLGVVSDLFGPCDALPADTRIAIASLVAVEGSPLPVLPGQLAPMHLPSDHGALADIVGLIASAEPRSLLAAIADLRLDEVVPGTAMLDDGPAAQPCPPRLLAILDRRNCSRWSQLAPLAIGAIQGWTNAGPGSVMALLRLGMQATVAAVAAPPPQPTDRLLGTLGQILAAIGSNRDRAAFEQLDLPVTGAPSATSIADALEVPYERIRHMCFRSRQRVRAAIRELGEPDPLGGAITAVSEQLGAACPLGAVDATLREAGLPNHHDTRSQLVLHLSGPYRPVNGHPGWVATRPSELTVATLALLREDGGVHLADQLAKELDVLGVAPAHARAWMLDQPVREVGDLVVLTRGAPLDVAERALNALGTSMTTADLAVWVFAEGQPRGHDSNRLFRSLTADRRFHRVGPDSWELVEWGSDLA